MYSSPFLPSKATLPNGVKPALAANGQNNQEWEPGYYTGSSETMVSSTPMKVKVLASGIQERAYNHFAQGHHSLD
jgi:hypothetical protein